MVPDWAADENLSARLLRNLLPALPSCEAAFSLSAMSDMTCLNFAGSLWDSDDSSLMSSPNFEMPTVDGSDEVDVTLLRIDVAEVELHALDVLRSVVVLLTALMLMTAPRGVFASTKEDVFPRQRFDARRLIEQAECRAKAAAALTLVHRHLQHNDHHQETKNGRDTREVTLPLLPSGPGGVHGPALSRPQVFYNFSSGEGGIRTHETLSSSHAFQACAFSHSATSPAICPSAES